MSLFERSQEACVYNNTGSSEEELEQELKESQSISITNIDRGYETLYYSRKGRWIWETARERSDKWTQLWKVIGDEGAKHFLENYVRLEEWHQCSPLRSPLSKNEAEQIRPRVDDLFKTFKR